MLQIDNGVVFRDLGAIPRLLQLMNSSGDEQLQTEATLTLGAALSRYCCRKDRNISLFLCIGAVIGLALLSFIVYALFGLALLVMCIHVCASLGGRHLHLFYSCH